MKTPEDIRHFCREELRHPLGAFERLRQRHARNIIFYLAIIIVPTVVLVATLDAHGGIKVGCVAIAVGILVWLIWSTLRGYKKRFKAQIMAPLVEFALPGAKYEPEEVIRHKWVVQSGLFRDAQDAKVTGSDRVIATVAARQVQVGQIRIQSRQGKNNNVVFWGMFAVGDLGIALPGHTVLLPNVSANLPGGILGQLLTALLPKHDGEKITFDDPTFDRTFDVYTTDPEGARRFFGDDLRDELGAWRQRLDARGAIGAQNTSMGRSMIALGDRHAYVAVSTTRNCFSPPVFTSLLDPAVLTGFVDDLCVPLEIVEILARHGYLASAVNGGAEF